MHVNDQQIKIDLATPNEFGEIGQLMYDVYQNLDGFPSPDEQPAYYEMLSNIGDFADKKSIELMIAKRTDEICGAVAYIGDMKDYGSGGTATMEKNAAGFRLLAVSHKARGFGIGKLLSLACIESAKKDKREQMIIHTTDAMKIAWGMYEKLGFERSHDLDFLQSGFPVYGFRLRF